ncbi:unnamed protein product [Cyprideis torosa]|uniref:Uncharacterized protein n=1 Tax=Cyprideis torosa TaxID=163714 RepID=A0A7R8WMC1_9CRUS|nr:unnamed protein product [Cyprideis torosa]CAG0899136.1 unnamed protein product [Cyprideis torosa]
MRTPFKHPTDLPGFHERRRHILWKNSVVWSGSHQKVCWCKNAFIFILKRSQWASVHCLFNFCQHGLYCRVIYSGVNGIPSFKLLILCDSVEARELVSSFLLVSCLEESVHNPERRGEAFTSDQPFVQRNSLSKRNEKRQGSEGSKEAKPREDRIHYFEQREIEQPCLEESVHNLERRGEASTLDQPFVQRNPLIKRNEKRQGSEGSKEAKPSRDAAVVIASVGYLLGLLDLMGKRKEISVTPPLIAYPPPITVTESTLAPPTASPAKKNRLQDRLI